MPGPVAIAVAAGEGQTATVGTPVSTQPQVLVTDGLGLPVAGVPVGFLVTAGAGSIDAETVTTNADGLASVQWTIGTAVSNATSAGNCDSWKSRRAASAYKSGILGTLR